MNVLKKFIVLLAFPLSFVMLLLSITIIFTPQASMQELNPRYVLKDNAGSPALYEQGENIPLRTFPTIFTRLLPFEQSVNLQNGVAIQTETDLENLINEYESLLK